MPTPSSPIFFIVVILGCLITRTNAQGCKAGLIGSECKIKAEAGTCRQITTVGELCFALNFPGPCDMSAQVFLRERMISDHKFTINNSSAEICFNPVIPLVYCQVCLTFKSVKLNSEGRVRFLCPELHARCPQEYKSVLTCLMPRFPLRENCVSTAAPTPEYSPFLPVTCIHNSECHGHGSCLAGKCHCDFGWTGDTCLDAKCETPCGPHSTCTAPNTCSCEDGWSGPSCSIQKTSQPTPGPSPLPTPGPSSPTPAVPPSSDGSSPNKGLIAMGSIAAVLVLIGGSIAIHHFWKKRAAERCEYDEMSKMVDEDDNLG